MSETWKTDRRIICATDDDTQIVVFRQIDEDDERSRYVLGNSTPVEVAGSNRFRIVETGTLLRRVKS